MYDLDENTIFGLSATTVNAQKSKKKLWHMWLGHVGQIGLIELSKKIYYVVTRTWSFVNNVCWEGWVE